MSLLSEQMIVIIKHTDCETDMREHFVIDPLIGKRQQLLLATQLCRMVLKINNVIIAGNDENDF